MRHLCLAICFLISIHAHALTDKDIQGYIDQAIKAGGGEVVLPPGVHEIKRALLFKDAKNIRLIGLDPETCVLKLPPLAFAETASDTAAGSDRIVTSRHQNLMPEMKLHIEAAGEIDSFTRKPKSSFLAVVKAIEGSTILLKQPLKFPVPAKAFIRHADAPNIIEIHGKSEGVRIEKLTLDGGRTEADPPVRGHVQLCGILAAGPYSYEKGPTGPRVKDVVVVRCIIKNCHGRGVAMYSAEAPVVVDCTIMDTTDEAVDLDHFTINAVVRHNNIARCPVGVELNDANDCLVIANEFRNCKTGINLWRWCKQPGLNEGNRIENNSFQDTAGNSVQIATGTAKNSVIGNEITRSGRNGISLAGSGQIVQGNKISESKMKAVAVSEGEHQISEK